MLMIDHGLDLSSSLQIIVEANIYIVALIKFTCIAHNQIDFLSVDSSCPALLYIMFQINCLIFKSVIVLNNSTVIVQ